MHNGPGMGSSSSISRVEGYMKYEHRKKISITLGGKQFTEEPPICKCGNHVSWCRHRSDWSNRCKRCLKKLKSRRKKIQKIKADGPPICACGFCNEYTKWNITNKRYNKYIITHNTKWWRLKHSIPPLCKCGCGKPVTWSKAGYKWNDYIQIHQLHYKRIKREEEFIKIKPPLCACGCGREVPRNGSSYSYLKYADGCYDHSEFNEKYWSIMENRILTSCTSQGLEREEWDGFKCTDEYCDAWNDREYKNFIRRRDGYTCRICGGINTIEGKKLSVHHINYNKQDCRPSNLISLCVSCHGKTNTNRKYWIEYFKDMIDKEEDI